MLCERVSYSGSLASVASCRRCLLSQASVILTALFRELATCPWPLLIVPLRLVRERGDCKKENV